MMRRTLARVLDYAAALRGGGWRHAICGHCGMRPTMADDCGFFYAEPDGQPICHHCWHGAPGAAHRAAHGVGER